MGFLRNRFIRRFTAIGRVLDAFLMAGIALRYAHRRGWVTDDLMRSVGLDSAVDSHGGPAGGSSGDTALGLSALWRVWRRRRLRR